MLELNKIYCEDNLTGIKKIDDNSIDMILTSPPYSDLRNYKGYSWNFEELAKEMFRVLKIGGVLVWVVGDKTKNGSEELMPFRQCLYFADIVGFNVWDTMIYAKTVCPFPANVRYNQMFEFMFVLTKGNAKTFNPLMERKSEKEIVKIEKGSYSLNSISFRNKNGETARADSDENMLKRITDSSKRIEKVKGNIFTYDSGYMKSSKDKETFDHPATYPEKLANDHIVSWTNENDIILDPFMGSGTTAKMCILNNRNYIGFEISSEYCDIANRRLSKLLDK